MYIDDYFTQKYVDGGGTIYTDKNIDDLSPKILEKVCAIQFATLGSFGMSGVMLLIDTDGIVYPVYYMGAKHTKRATTLRTTRIYDYLCEFFPFEKMQDNEDGMGKPYFRIGNWNIAYTGVGWFELFTDEMFGKVKAHINYTEGSTLQDIVYSFPEICLQILEKN